VDSSWIIIVGVEGQLGDHSGNWAETSNENTGLRAIVSNIHHKKFVMNVRRNFQTLPLQRRKDIFQEKR
jgi:hypothetical protein